MAGPVQNDSQYKQLPTLVIPSSIGGKTGQFNSSAPVTGSRVNYNSGLFQNQGGVTRPPMISPGNRSVVAPNSTPVTYNQGLFPQGGGTPGGMSYGNLFSNQNPILQNMGGILGAGIKGGGQAPLGVTGAGVGAGGGAGAADNTHPDEKRWKILADKYGVSWDVTKNIYMRSPRNPGFSPSVALELQLDDKAWGDAARAAGILTGNADYDNQVWVDHYNANGNMASDPMAGHNYAIMAYQANQQAIQDQVNGTPTPPEWL
jgi:hypothetical protein